MARQLTFHHRLNRWLVIPLSIFLFVGCSNPSQTSVEMTQTSSVPAATPTLAIPTPTPMPMALLVNNEGIPVVEFEAELARYQASQQALGGAQTVEEQRQVVQEDLIDQLLLAQGAAEQGFVVDESTLQTHLDSLTAQLGGADALAQWETDHGYTADEFTTALRRSIAVAWMRDQIAATIPETAEQVHVRQIRVPTQADADYALARLVPGMDFATLAFKYDTVTGGDLGWFPRGYLAETAIEDAAFSLEVDGISAIIQTGVGFHIIQLIEKDPNRVLSPDARQVLQKKAIQSWLQTRREQSQIQIVTP